MENFFWCMSSELPPALNWSCHFTLAVAVLRYIHDEMLTCMCKSMHATYSCPVLDANSIRKCTHVTEKTIQIS